jgi:hypothetical protein
MSSMHSMCGDKVGARDGAAGAVVDGAGRRTATVAGAVVLVLAGAGWCEEVADICGFARACPLGTDPLT